MPSDSQIEANQRNAQLSTGTRTDGKAHSRANAIKHGMAGDTWERLEWVSRERLRMLTGN
jgi:hypothetical protein